MTHGTLTNIKTGQTLTGSMEHEEADFIDFRIDGTRLENSLDPKEWTWTADKAPHPLSLPPERNVVMFKRRGFLPTVVVNRAWYQVTTAGDTVKLVPFEARWLRGGILYYADGTSKEVEGQ